MSGPLFEQYKSALRRGHLAALDGSLDDALQAYREAARLVPERALPFASLATVLHRLDRWPEAAAAFDKALDLAPDDEATLRARARARDERGLRSDAAADFERLAFVLDVAGRAADAANAARRAVELEASPARTGLLARLAGPAARAAAPSPADAPAAAPAESTQPAPPAAPPAQVAPPAQTPPAHRIVAVTAAEAARAANAVDPAQSWPRLDLPTPQPPPTFGPPPDPESLLTNAMVLLDAGELSAARDLMLSAVFIHRQAGRLDAALDVCLQLLEIVPGDPQVHLAIANLQLDRGWTALATEKIELLRELTSLTGDTQAEADVHGLAAERLRDVPARSTAAR